MNNKKKNFIDTIFKSSIIIYCCVIALCALTAISISLPLGLVLFAVLIIMLIHMVIEQMNREKKMAQYFEKLTYDIDKVGKESLLRLSTPAVGIWLDGRIKWYNNAFKALFDEEIFDKPITDFIKTIEIDNIIKIGNEEKQKIEINNKIFIISGSLVEEQEGEEGSMLITFDDITDLFNLQKKFVESRNVIAHISVDNYDETVLDAPDEIQPQITAALDTLIAQWFQNSGGILKKLERDKFIAIFDQSTLDEFVSKKFDILDLAREINLNTKISPTLSIGVGVNGETMAEIDSFARAAHDMALGRGGDQVVIKDQDSFTYYGGKSKEVEKRTKVKARVMAHALRELIMQADNVLIMGHKLADADNIGASIGIACAVGSCGKISRILLGTKDETVSAILENIEKNNYHEGLFINKQQAKDFITSKTLLVICDTHKQALIEYPEFLDLVNRKVIIDHHRRGEDFINGADLVYHEPFASSASEMVTEVLQYIDSRISLNTIDASALYAGIVVDTKNFTFKTGVRTFEAAAYLRKAGVDTIKVKKLFQTSMVEYKERTQIVAEAKIYHDNIAIATAEGDISHTVMAQAADELLEIEGVHASFVLINENDNAVSISGRSLGEINVQMILEKLDGGGHMLVAGAQIRGVTLEEAVKRLCDAIDEYFSNSNQ